LRGGKGGKSIIRDMSASYSKADPKGRRGNRAGGLFGGLPYSRTGARKYSADSSYLLGRESDSPEKRKKAERKRIESRIWNACTEKGSSSRGEMVLKTSARPRATS